MFFTAYVFGEDWDYSNSTLKDKQKKKQKTSLKSYKTEIKILANPVVT